jgi:hypothetical protein
MANDGNNSDKKFRFWKLEFLFVRLGHILVLLMRGSKEKDLRYFKYLSVTHGSSVDTKLGYVYYRIFESAFFLIEEISSFIWAIIESCSFFNFSRDFSKKPDIWSKPILKQPHRNDFQTCSNAFFLSSTTLTFFNLTNSSRSRSSSVALIKEIASS